MLLLLCQRHKLRSVTNSRAVFRNVLCCPASAWIVTEITCSAPANRLDMTIFCVQLERVDYVFFAAFISQLYLCKGGISKGLTR